MLTVVAVTYGPHRAEQAVTTGVLGEGPRGGLGEFNWSLQHLDTGGVYGQTIELGQGVHWEIGAEVAGSAIASQRDSKTLLA